MAEYIISCESTADLSKENFDARNIKYICFHYSLDGVSYPDDLGQSVSFPDFYKKLEEGADPATSQVNIAEYMEYFESFLSQGSDILHCCLSSGISGSANSAQNAAMILREKYPERTIRIVDSLAASSGFGLLMDKLADLRDEGMTVNEAADWCEANKLRVNHWFFSSDLTFFIKGGRISKAAGLFGGVLHICPLMNVDHVGRLIPREKIRGKKLVTKEIVKKMQQLAENGADYNGKCYISHSNCYEDACAVRDLVEENFPNLKGKVEIFYIGTTIGAHTGPGTVALFFWGQERQN